MKNNCVKFVKVNEMFSRRRKVVGIVFPDENGDRIEVKRLNAEIAKACKRAGIRIISCHALRHTFASHLVMKGASLKEIQELLGHANIQITMRYAHLAPSALHNAISLLEPDHGKMFPFGQPAGNRTLEPLSIESVKRSRISQNPVVSSHIFEESNL